MAEEKKQRQRVFIWIWCCSLWGLNNIWHLLVIDTFCLFFRVSFTHIRAHTHNMHININIYLLSPYAPCMLHCFAFWPNDYAVEMDRTIVLFQQHYYFCFFDHSLNTLTLVQLDSLNNYLYLSIYLCWWYFLSNTVS